EDLLREGPHGGRAKSCRDQCIGHLLIETEAHCALEEKARQLGRQGSVGCRSHVQEIVGDRLTGAATEVEGKPYAATRRRRNHARSVSDKHHVLARPRLNQSATWDAPRSASGEACLAEVKDA